MNDVSFPICSFNGIDIFNDGFIKARSSRTDFTSVEHQLDRNISNILRQLGQSSILVNEQNLIWLMQQIGANLDPITAGFVVGRMQTNLEAHMVIQKADNLLAEISQKYYL
jgi:hypothetical protein